VGHWVVDFNEEDCTPHWGKFVDKVRRFKDTFVNRSDGFSLTSGMPGQGVKNTSRSQRPRDTTSCTEIYF